MSDVENVRGWVHTAKGESYDVFMPVNMSDQMSEGDDGWVSLALVEADEYICLRVKDVTYVRRDMTAAEKQRRHTIL